MKELKSCPFCEGKAEFVEYVCPGNKLYYVMCVDCGAGTIACDARDEAVAKWNRLLSEAEEKGK